MIKRLMGILLLLIFANTLYGCGIFQSISDGTTKVAKAIFVRDVKTLHLDFTARAELNTDDDSHPSPVFIRVYQLRYAKSFESASYQSLVTNDKDILGETLLDMKEIILKPNTSISLDVPLDVNADYVGVIALFKEPDLKMDNWRILLKRSDLNVSRARKIIANKFMLELIED